MSYRCGICDSAVPPGRPRLVHTEYRPGGKQIAAETPVCLACRTALTAGHTAASLRRVARRRAEENGDRQRGTQTVTRRVTVNPTPKTGGIF
jgi:hypothetical protein